MAEKIAALGIQQWVVMPGRVPHDQVQSYYNLVDIFIYPRLSMRLTDLVTPLKPLEAMAQGRLVIASDVGGHKELIRDHQTGYLFRSGDKSDLAQTVINVMELADIDGICRDARRFVEEERSWIKSVAHYSDVYSKVRAGT
ncbi:glycosyltransferase [Methylomonas koyamae]|uniref:glycosyltransferase n=1 Tax=Methylomonas koyamae TaxID=702114 RepID=UPI00278C327A|nr:glycosyltransferase [Methylomonas koyamae]